MTSENGGNIQLTFRSFNVEYHPSCAYDWVEVLYGVYSEKLCGGENGDYLPGPFCGGRITIKFHSDGGVAGAGFRAEWEELATPCIYSIVSHADYPNSNYPKYADEVTYNTIITIF